MTRARRPSCSFSDGEALGSPACGRPATRFYAARGPSPPGAAPEARCEAHLLRLWVQVWVLDPGSPWRQVSLGEFLVAEVMSS